MRSIFLVISQGTVTLKIKSMKVCSKLLRGGGEEMERGWRGGRRGEERGEERGVERGSCH